MVSKALDRLAVAVIWSLGAVVGLSVAFVVGAVVWSTIMAYPLWETLKFLTALCVLGFIIIWSARRVGKINKRKGMVDG